jgi:GAF domain-containing protein
VADQGSNGGDAFAGEYAATLQAYVARPSAEGLAAADALGQRALHAGFSMLELVAVHLEHRRELIEDKGPGQLRDMDDFLTEALSSFEVTQRAFVESQKDAAAARERAASLALLTDTYLAIASHATLEARLEEVCVQAKRFLAADDARVGFGQRAEAGPVGRDSITVRLRGGGRLTVIASAGRTWSDPDRMALKQFAVLVSAPVDDARRLQFSQRIAHVGRLLGGQLEPDEVAAKVVEQGADVIGASWIRISPEGDPATLPAGSSDAHFHSESSDEDAPTWAALPLAGADEAFGVLVIGYDEAQPFDEVQRSFLQDAARRVTAAFERSTAYARERESRREAELASARLRHLEELATELGRVLTRRGAAELLSARVLTSTAACGALVVVTRPRPGSTEVLAASGPFGEGDEELIEALGPVLHVGAGDAGIEPAAFTLADLAPPARQQLEALGVRAINRYPMVARPFEATVLVVASSDPAGAGPADDELVRAQVGIAGPNLMRAERYDEEHEFANTLQRSMLAVPPLSMPGLRWAVYYRAGSARLAGGDWYDLVAIDDQRIGIAVGDIVGRGIEASASMGQLRSATRALAGRVTDPAELLSELDNFASTTGHGLDSSVAYALVDTERELINVSLAGHPPPVIRRPDGAATLFEGGRGPLLGWGDRRQSGVRRIEPGTQAVFYTDGLVERRDETLDVGLRRLLESVAALDETLPPAGVCEALIDRMAVGSDETRRDDIAVVAVEFRGR